MTDLEAFEEFYRQMGIGWTARKVDHSQGVPPDPHPWEATVIFRLRAGPRCHFCFAEDGTYLGSCTGEDFIPRAEQTTEALARIRAKNRELLSDL